MPMPEHELIADLIAKQRAGDLDDDREPTTRRIKHSCGHLANVTIWGEYRLEDRFTFGAERRCYVCMAYRSWIHTGSLPQKLNATICRSKWDLFEVMNKIIEMHDIQGESCNTDS